MTKEQKLVKKYYVDNKEKPLFKAEYVDRALHDIFDIEERALLNFVLLGDAAKACVENKAIELSEIEMVLPYRSVTPEVESNFKTWNFTPEEWGYSWTYSPDTLWHIKIPIRLFLYNKYKLFDNPNRVWGTTEGFLVPNPFSEYWSARHLIRGKLMKGSL